MHDREFRRFMRLFVAFRDFLKLSNLKNFMNSMKNYEQDEIHIHEVLRFWVLMGRLEIEFKGKSGLA